MISSTRATVQSSGRRGVFWNVSLGA